MCVVTLVQEHLFAQVVVMVFFATLQVAYLTSFKPFTEPLFMKLDILNEVTTVILVDLLVALSDANQSRFDLEVDIIFLSCLFGNLSVHIFLLMKNLTRRIYLQCKKRRFCCRTIAKKRPLSQQEILDQLNQAESKEKPQEPRQSSRSDRRLSVIDEVESNLESNSRRNLEGSSEGQNLE